MEMERVSIVRWVFQLQILLTVMVTVGLDMDQMSHQLSLLVQRLNGTGAK